MSLAQTTERPTPARWRSLHQDSFIRRSHANWLMHGDVLTPTEDEAEEMQGIDLEAYDFQEQFLKLTRQNRAIA